MCESAHDISSHQHKHQPNIEHAFEDLDILSSNQNGMNQTSVWLK